MCGHVAWADGVGPPPRSAVQGGIESDVVVCYNGLLVVWLRFCMDRPGSVDPHVNVGGSAQTRYCVRGDVLCRLTVCTLALACACLGRASADVVTLDASKDNTIYSEADDRSNGAGDHFFCGRTGSGGNRRALLAFDIAAAVTPGSTIDGVVLRLYMSRTTAGASSVNLYPVTTDWGEGSSHASGNEGGGAIATDGDATWRYPFYDTEDPKTAPFWARIGGDFSTPAAAGTSVGGTGYYSWGTNENIVADVQDWLDAPESNYGWLLIGQEIFSRSSKRFDSRSNLTVSRRPQLTVTFTPPIAFGACCFADGSCLEQFAPDCGGQGSAFQGDGTTCTPNLCPQTGACCRNDGSCSVETQGDCSAADGVYLGAGTDCTPNECPQPGACCFDDGTCQALILSKCDAAFASFEGEGSLCSPNPCPIFLEPFVDALPIPTVAQPISGTVGGEATYAIAMTEFNQKLHRDLPPTTVWGYGGTFPGPTIEATSGMPVTVNWINDLRNDLRDLRSVHYLPVDLCMHGPDHAGPTARTVVHLHGGHVPAEFDGDPEATILPGQSAVYVYPNRQLPATLWYHDHALGITRLNVYMGLAAFYIVRDAFENSLNLPSGEFEIPIVLQDRSFQSDGALRYPAIWQDMYFGDKMLVNGKVWPYLEVKQGRYRFRVLNGSNARTMILAMSNSAAFHLIGTDGGLLDSTLSINQMTLAPAERADVIIDFGGYVAGTEIILTNSAPAPLFGDPGEGLLPEVMKFVVTGDIGDTLAIPTSLRPIEMLDEQDAVASRDFVIRRAPESSPSCAAPWWLINDLGWDDITENPVLGSTEIWRFINRSGMMHPMHMHLVMFQVLDRQSFEVIDDEIVPIGSPIPPGPTESGWKDTVRANPQEITRVIARFEDYTGRFPYHCHILEHEDHEMMRQFEVVGQPAIPAASAWGVLAMILSMLTAGSLVLRKRRHGDAI